MVHCVLLFLLIISELNSIMWKKIIAVIDVTFAVEKLIFFHIILHCAVHIYDFYIFITLSLISYAVLITNHRFISVIDAGIFSSNSTRKSKV